MRCSIVHPLVHCTLVARQRDFGIVVTEVSFGPLANAQKARSSRSIDPRLKKYAALVKSFLDGRVRSLDRIPIDTSWCTPFQKKVLDETRKIPWGKTLSYGELADKAGYPKAVRAVASVMRNNRFPLIVPCHRIIGKNGKIGGFMGAKSGNPVLLKQNLLCNEGLDFRVLPP